MTPLLLRLLILAGLSLAIGGTIVILRRYFSSAEIPTRFNLADIGADVGDIGADVRRNGSARTAPAAIVEFVTPFCYECREALPLLKAASKVYEAPLAVIDARERPELASKYSIRHTPTILVVDSRGSVRGGWLGVPPEGELEAAIVTAGGVSA